MTKNKKQKRLINHVCIVNFVILIIVAVILYLMGRIPICECGYIKLWHGVVQSSENSQHIFDWYTFSHVIHGIIFYYLLTKLFKNLPFQIKLIIAVLIESGWEVLENTPFIINRYRNTTASLDYTGDTIINSLFDILSMVIGFYAAKKLPVWLSVLLIVLMEVIVGYIIRDNLTLNVVMLIYPFEFIKNWQFDL